MDGMLPLGEMHSTLESSKVQDEKEKVISQVFHDIGLCADNSLIKKKKGENS